MLTVMLPPFDPWLTGAIAGDVVTASLVGGNALAERCERRLTALLKSVASQVPFYRRLLVGKDPTRLTLQDLPVVRKRELMRNFADWVGDPAIEVSAIKRFTADPTLIGAPFLDRYTIWEGSGTTGEPAVFVQDARAMAVYDALEAVRRPLVRPLQRLIDPWGFAERAVFVGATSGHFASNVSIERLRRLNPALKQQLHGISFLQPIDRVVAELHAHAPTVVATYPSAAVVLAEERRAGRLRISPREIWTGGENLTPAMRQYVRDAFECPVVNSYGASEFLSLASECREGRLHLNSDWAILESVDEQGAAVAPGERGATTLLTNLANHVQPIIRYDLGDRIALPAAGCRCGSSLPVVDVCGRDDATLWLGTPGVAVLPLALSTVLEDEAELFDFQLVQEGPGALLLCTAQRGTAAGDVLRRARSVLAGFLASQGVRDVQIRSRRGAAGHRGRSGKIQRVVGLPRAAVP